jgi:hypothetical protein
MLIAGRPAFYEKEQQRSATVASDQIGEYSSPFWIPTYEIAVAAPAPGFSSLSGFSFEMAKMTTTLITFMLWVTTSQQDQSLTTCRNHPTAQFVELYGSWDNFSSPWQMKRDSRRGWGTWSGLHRFQNIICDGDAASHPPQRKTREFGLLMGGTYWYYVRIFAFFRPTECWREPSVGMQALTRRTPRMGCQPRLGREVYRRLYISWTCNRC